MNKQEFNKYVFDESLTKDDVFSYFGIPEQFKEFVVIPYTRVQNGEFQKHPSYGWAKYREEEFDYNKFFKNHTDLENTNFCVLTEDIAELDIDDAIIYEKFKFDKIETLTVKSGSGGYKLYFTCDEMPPRIVKVNNFPVDIITRGNLSVIPPSHNRNGPYTVFKDLPILHIKSFDELIKKIPSRIEKHTNIKDFKEKLDLIQVIDDHGVELDSQGKIYRGLCPFHDEITPSFTVYTKTDTFFCFGCQTSGDVITFIEKKLGYDFKEAVRYLADKYGIERPALTAKEKKADDDKKSALSALEDAEMELWHHDRKDAYITLVVNGVQENYKLGTEKTLYDIQDLIAEKTGTVTPKMALETFIGWLSSVARRSKNYTPFVRCGYDDENYYLDLSNEKRQIIKINKEGWSIIDRCPVKFIRTEGQRELLTPTEGGSLDPLFDLLAMSEIKEGEDIEYRNGVNAKNRAFIAAALVESLVPVGPKTVKHFDGQHGSFKTMTMHLLMRLIDDRLGLIGAIPKTLDDYYINCLDSWLVGLDNLRTVSNEWSDIICRVATGIGIVKRRLYTDDEKFSAEVLRGQWINGIGQLGFRNDLLDRSVFIQLLPPISRLSPEEIKTRFEKIRPEVLGALLDMLVLGLNNISEIGRRPTPDGVRMVDYYRWGCASLNQDYKFEKYYLDMIKDTWIKQIEGDYMSYQVFQYCKDLSGPYTLTPKKFMEVVIKDADVDTFSLPKSAKFVVTYLKQRIPALAFNGVKVEILEGKDRKSIKLYPIDKEKAAILLKRDEEDGGEPLEEGDPWS